MSFLEESLERREFQVRETGPALLPAALPAWLDSVFARGASDKSYRAPLFLAVTAGHAALISALLTQVNALDLVKMAEHSRLTVIRISQSLKAEVKDKPEIAAEPTQEPVQAEGTPPAIIEWSRVANWRPKANGTAASTTGNGNDYDATRLLAGLGASGPAGAADGVADPYAGASPVWAGNGAKSALMLVGAPNPAVLEQIRQRVSLTFRGMTGSAKITVMVDREGVVTGIAQIETDIPEPARDLLEKSLLGRVVSVRRSAPTILDLPTLTFA